MLALSSVLLIASLVFIYIGLRRLLDLRSMSKWPVTEGIIVVSEFHCVLPPSEGHGIYRPSLTYSYSLKGQSYNSSPLGINQSSFDHFNETSIRNFVSKNSVGSKILIRVDPSDPSQSILDPGASAPRRSHYFALVSAGIILGSLALALLYYFYT